MKFKKGDKVYLPHRDLKIWTIISMFTAYESPTHPMRIGVVGDTKERNYLLTEDGKLNRNDKNPIIFPANQKNYELLSQLYDGDFEKPPVIGSELTKEILKDKYQLCWVSDNSDQHARKGANIRLVVHHSESVNYFETADGEEYEYAVPIEIVNGTEIREITK